MHDVPSRHEVAVGEATALEPVEHDIGVLHRQVSSYGCEGILHCRKDVAKLLLIC